MSTTILLIMSDGELAAKLSGFLDSMHFRVVQSKSGMKGVQLAYEVNPDLILIDQALSDLKGAHISQLIKKSATHKTVPVILMAPASERKALVKSPDIAWDRLLQKPFEPMELYQLILTTLQMKKEAEKAVVQNGDSVLVSQASSMFDSANTDRDRPDAAGGSRSMELSGALSRIPIARLLHSLLKSRMSGLLSLELEEQSLDIRFTMGRPSHLHSNFIPDVTLGKFLVDQGRITDRQREELWRMACEEGVKFGSALETKNIVTSDELPDLLIRQSNEKLLITFKDKWRQGQYRFAPGRILEAEAFQIDSETGPLILSGIRRFYDASRIQRYFSRRNRMELPLLKNTNHFYNISRMGLKEWEAKLYTSLTGIYTPQDVIAASGGDRNRALNFLYAMLVMDLLRQSPTLNPHASQNGGGFKH